MPSAKAGRRRAGIATRFFASSVNSYSPTSTDRCMAPLYPTIPHNARLLYHSSPLPWPVVGLGHDGCADARYAESPCGRTRAVRAARAASGHRRRAAGPRSRQSRSGALRRGSVRLRASWRRQFELLAGLQRRRAPSSGLSGLQRRSWSTWCFSAITGEDVARLDDVVLGLGGRLGGCRLGGDGAGRGSTLSLLAADHAELLMMTTTATTATRNTTGAA